MTNQATRFIVRAIGELAGGAEHDDFDENLFGIDDGDDRDTSTATPIVHNPQSKNEKINYKLYKPTIVGGDWIVSETDLCMNQSLSSIFCSLFDNLDFIKEGWGVLGTVCCKPFADNFCYTYFFSS